MKKVLTMMLIVTSLVCLSSCSSEEEVYIPQEVDLTLSYSFAESGSMTKATGAEVYNDFYENYIKSKQLTPKNYSLTFKNKATGTVATINGLWGNKDGVRLVEGEYEVTGKSFPITTESTSIAECISDSVYLSFNESVNITKDMTSLNLTAKYDSYLLMLDSENYSKVYYELGSYVKDLYKTNSLYYLFVERLSYGNNSNFLRLIRKNGKKSVLVLEQFPFEKGKYYYFNDITNSFDIPPMESGN